MYRVVNAFMEIFKATEPEAIQTARLNAAAVYDDHDRIIADFRTVESESDERG